MPTELFYIYFINLSVACQSDRTIVRLPRLIAGPHGKRSACRDSPPPRRRRAIGAAIMVRGEGAKEDSVQRFRQMVDQGMLVEDSDGNPVGKVCDVQGDWFVLEHPDGHRQQVWYDTIQNLLGNTIILSIPKSQLFGKAA